MTTPTRSGGARTRLFILLVIVAVAVLGAGGYVWHTQRQQTAAEQAAPEVSTRDDVAAVTDQPHLVFRSTALGDGYGRVAVVPLSDPDGPRAFTPAACERVYATAVDAICLSADRGLVTTYTSRLLGADFTVTRDLPLTGLPSRARLSRDGTLSATTTFVFGDSYTSPGQFSTRTLVTDVQRLTTVDLEEFALFVDGEQNTSADRNLWGVTFADDDTFYATAASDATTWLVRGSLSQRRLTSIRTDVECPSLSPDKTRIAFKKHGDLPDGQWRLAVYDLTTGAETVLDETHNLDDQAEWLDDDHVLYGLPRAEADSASSDIWVVPADGSGTPRVLVHDAWSPAVVR